MGSTKQKGKDLLNAINSISIFHKPANPLIHGGGQEQAAFWSMCSIDRKKEKEREREEGGGDEGLSTFWGRSMLSHAG